MGYPLYRRTRLPYLALLWALSPALPTQAQEIPLDHCDGLPGIAVTAADWAGEQRVRAGS